MDSRSKENGHSGSHKRALTLVIILFAFGPYSLFSQQPCFFPLVN